MTDGRAIVALTLAGLVAVGAVRGSRGVVRTGKPAPPPSRKAELDAILAEAHERESGFIERPGPSIKRMIEAFGDVFEHDGWDPKDAAETLKRAMRSDLGPWGVLSVANRILGGHGVEELSGNPGVLYVNMGDTYTMTLYYDEKSKRYVASDWGTLVERSPKRFA